VLTGVVWLSDGRNRQCLRLSLFETYANPNAQVSNSELRIQLPNFTAHLESHKQTTPVNKTPVAGAVNLKDYDVVLSHNLW